MKQAITKTIILISTYSLLGDSEGRGQLLDGSRHGDMDVFEAMHNNDNREASVHIDRPATTYIAPVKQPTPK